MFFIQFILASLAIVTAVSSKHFHALDTKVFGKRQEYQPTTSFCGPGNTCEASCGPGYIDCGDPTENLCYNPANAQTCCEPGSADPWSCPNGDYCLVDGYCCPSGLDPTACALSYSVTLPATFVGPTTTPGVLDSSSGVPNVTPAVATISSVPPGSTGTGSFSPSVASPSVAVFTGAASPNTITGRTGLIYGVLALIGNLL
ncbi:hypothetical protein W97_07652 [Coniosporium apollinis CBS 100218]|uniref:Uncharacterized protein n=1 Tax=Coniosporium apollinis (strain CBS 100218) TaxID=1168221 RepID=R7Z2Q2_CONA1|nr:uncharacterized protein W97_07652 [Coniosporium apollinis CBS 100218]EON68442.1 hypothetical protein W97_07652 [Coniosporium apollinis CBS 100218]